MKTIAVHNNETIHLEKIPILSYDEFFTLVSSLMASSLYHCVNYFAYPEGDLWRLIGMIANDETHQIHLLSHTVSREEKHKRLPSLTAKHYALHVFEREITETTGIHFEGHPWAKPLRYAHNQFDLNSTIAQYPFYKIDSPQLHHVGVGPIHAGIIEPGYFRFICKGEKVLHLEIQLGWQHRGVEPLFVNKKTLLQKNILAESIAGDTAIGHTLAFVKMMEAMGGIEIPRRLSIERTIALELERIAIHLGDLSALCADVGYQLGSAVFGVLRTPVINFTQLWCGNRLGKGLLRVAGSHYPLNLSLKAVLIQTLDELEPQFKRIAKHTFKSTSILERWEHLGRLSVKQAELLGVVGMAARSSGIRRDIRLSHPFEAFKEFPYEPVVFKLGDIYSRALLRRREIEKSMEFIKKLMAILDESDLPAPYAQEQIKLAPESLAFSLTEGWRGEICHCGITDKQGQLIYYKIKDPSLHNWMALSVAVRNQEISDFPVCNKSFNLSYCGHDL